MLHRQRRGRETEGGRQEIQKEGRKKGKKEERRKLI